MLWRAILIVGIVVPSTAFAESIESLQVRCAQKTIVWNREGTKVGEKMDGYCLGFLEGAMGVMRHANLICIDEAANGPFLHSVFTTYVNDQKPKGVDATEAITAAYQRAFPCKK
jgi:hypothetical protein